MYKGASLSTPPSRIEHRSAIKIETLPVVYEFEKIYHFPPT